LYPLVTETVKAIRLLTLLLVVTPWALGPPARSVATTIAATIDTDERQTTPVPHRYIHGVIPDDAKFQLALPENWNGKLAIFSRAFPEPSSAPDRSRWSRISPQPPRERQRR
jgi:hypothetical protein